MAAMPFQGIQDHKSDSQVGQDPLTQESVATLEGATASRGDEQSMFTNLSAPGPPDTNVSCRNIPSIHINVHVASVNLNHLKRRSR